MRPPWVNVSRLPLANYIGSTGTGTFGGARGSAQGPRLRYGCFHKVDFSYVSGSLAVVRRCERPPASARSDSSPEEAQSTEGS